jgi:hypothetical protein
MTLCATSVIAAVQQQLATKMMRRGALSFFSFYQKRDIP